VAMKRSERGLQGRLLVVPLVLLVLVVLLLS
jgi:hypothetical protein